MSTNIFNQNKPSPLSDDFVEVGTKDDARFGEITVLKNHKTNELVMQKEKISHKEEDRDRDVFQALERMKLNHGSLLNMIGYSSYENTEPDNKFFRVRGYYEYIENNLMEEIQNRKSEGRSFKSSELRSLFVSFIDALAFLQNKKMVHGDVRPIYITFDSDKEEFKLADRLGDPSSPNQVQIHNMQGAKMLYMSNSLYEKLSMYTGGELKVRHNPYKSDIFSLGLVVVETGIMESVQDIYEQSPCSIDERRLKSLVTRFCEKYSDDSQLVAWVKRIVTKTESGRPTFKVIAGELKEMREKEEKIRLEEERVRQEEDAKRAREAEEAERQRKEVEQKLKEAEDKKRVEEAKTAAPVVSSGGGMGVVNSLMSGVARNTAPEIKGNTFVGPDGRLVANYIKCVSANGEVSYKPNPALANPESGVTQTQTHTHKPTPTTTHSSMAHSTPARTVISGTHPTSTTSHPRTNPLSGSNPLARTSMGTHSHVVTHPATTTHHSGAPLNHSVGHPTTTTHPTTTSHPGTTTHHAPSTETRRVVQNHTGPTTTTNTTAPRVGSITRDGSHTHPTTNYTTSSYQPKTYSTAGQHVTSGHQNHTTTSHVHSSHQQPTTHSRTHAPVTHGQSHVLSSSGNPLISGMTRTVGSVHRQASGTEVRKH